MRAIEARPFWRSPLGPMPEKETAAAFIEPMLLLRTEKLPEGPGWLVELFLQI